MAERVYGTGDRVKQAGRGQARREQKAARADASPPASALEALERARQHGRAAAAEALCAIHALVDAASLATTGVPAEAHRGLALLARALDDVAGAFGEGEGALLGAVADALDAEIGRWEQRATQDPDARAVLRAYLGLRELLWELGVRRPTSAEAGTEKPNGARATTRADALRRRTAIQRVPLEG
ncbi:MAG TPA: hypothetical protein VKM54_27090, partial [Myxococcota bacterium]|nr:hypothetical protein [Myxococcota bacterium]